MLPAARGIYPDEAVQRRTELIKSYATDAVQIDVDFMPDESEFMPWTRDGKELPTSESVNRAHQLSAQRAQQAEAEGYDAFCPFGLLDIGVNEARRRGVRIAVVGAAESCALICGLLGRRFAKCVYQKNAGVDNIRTRIADWGVSDLYVGLTAIGIPNSEYPQRRDEVRARFIDCAQEAREKDAEIMGLIGMSICPTEFSAKELSDASGMPVMDGLAAQMSMVDVWNRTGLPSDMLRMPRRSDSPA